MKGDLVERAYALRFNSWPEDGKVDADTYESVKKLLKNPIGEDAYQRNMHSWQAAYAGLMRDWGIDLMMTPTIGSIPFLNSSCSLTVLFPR
jgi:hypothetical protein